MPGAVKVLDNLDDYFVQQLKETRLSSSTSTMSRACAIARTESATDIWFYNSSFSRSLHQQIVQALANA